MSSSPRCGIKKSEQVPYGGTCHPKKKKKCVKMRGEGMKYAIFKGRMKVLSKLSGKKENHAGTW